MRSKSLRALLKLIAVCLAVALTLVGLALPMPTRADNIFNESIPIAPFTFVPCADGGAGEVIFLGGALHLVLNITVDSGQAGLEGWTYG